MSGNFHYTSRLGEGTYKTSSFIDTSSDKYLNRSDLGRHKFGSNGQQSGHIFGWGLANVIATNTGS